MSLALLITVAVISILSLAVIGHIFYNRKNITCMTGMMIAMTLGMMVGLTAGAILGVVFNGDLFRSTLLAMGIGIAAGFLTGAFVSVMAVLDGTLAGIMGGMMGAMLGEMIPSDDRDMLIKIMFVLFVGITLILFYMLQQEFARKNGVRARLFHNPLFMALSLGIFFFGYNQLGATIPLSLKDQMEGSHPMPSQMERQQKEEKVGTTSLLVQAKEFAFFPEQMVVFQGQPTKLVLQNIGNQAHDLEIVGLQAKVMEPGQNHHKQKNAVHLHTAPGESQELTFVPQETGVFHIICTLPGHQESGMEAIIKVI
ncbi:hypothetical protein BSNK01_22780 [Bacillaceae bacterium]